MTAFNLSSKSIAETGAASPHSRGGEERRACRARLEAIVGGKPRLEASPVSPSVWDESKPASAPPEALLPLSPWEDASRAGVSPVDESARQRLLDAQARGSIPLHQMPPDIQYMMTAVVNDMPQNPDEEYAVVGVDSIMSPEARGRAEKRSGNPVFVHAAVPYNVLLIKPRGGMAFHVLELGNPRGRGGSAGGESSGYPR